MKNPHHTTTTQLPAFVKRRALLMTLIPVSLVGSVFTFVCFGTVMLASDLAVDKAVTTGHLQAGQVSMFDMATALMSLGMALAYIVMALIAVPLIIVAYIRTRQFYQRSLATCAGKAGIAWS